MNDFTKSELSIIHLVVMRDINQFAHILKTSPSMIELRDKLEEMIDNYCEHEFIATIDYKDWSKREAYAIPMCRKCKRSPEVTK